MLGELASYGFNSEDQLVALSKGTFANLKSFLDQNQHRYKDVRAVLLLLFGADEIGMNPPPLPPTSKTVVVL